MHQNRTWKGQLGHADLHFWGRLWYSSAWLGLKPTKRDRISELDVYIVVIDVSVAICGENRANAINWTLSLGRHSLFQSLDSEARPTKSSIKTAITKSAPPFFFLLLTPLSERQQETGSVNIFPTYAQLKTSNFTCAELNSYFSQPFDSTSNLTLWTMSNLTLSIFPAI